MTYRVQPTAQAEADIDRIFDWLHRRSPDGARRWYEAFWDSAERLKSFPQSCGLAPESRDFPEEVRQMLFKTRRGRTYRALFVIRGDLVHILCVRGPGERPVKPEDIET
jgi:plasmid stabilization system protein ParE